MASQVEQTMGLPLGKDSVDQELTNPWTTLHRISATNKKLHRSIYSHFPILFSAITWYLNFIMRNLFTGIFLLETPSGKGSVSDMNKICTQLCGHDSNSFIIYCAALSAHSLMTGKSAKLDLY